MPKSTESSFKRGLDMQPPVRPIAAKFAAFVFYGFISPSLSMQAYVMVF